MKGRWAIEAVCLVMLKRMECSFEGLQSKRPPETLKTMHTPETCETETCKRPDFLKTPPPPPPPGTPETSVEYGSNTYVSYVCYLYMGLMGVYDIRGTLLGFLLQGDPYYLGIYIGRSPIFVQNPIHIKVYMSSGTPFYTPNGIESP